MKTERMIQLNGEVISVLISDEPRGFSRLPGQPGELCWSVAQETERRLVSGRILGGASGRCRRGVFWSRLYEGIRGLPWMIGETKRLLI